MELAPMLFIAWRVSMLLVAIVAGIIAFTFIICGGIAFAFTICGGTAFIFTICADIAPIFICPNAGCAISFICWTPGWLFRTLPFLLPRRDDPLLLRLLPLLLSLFPLLES